MAFSALTQRIAGEGRAAWHIHNRALALQQQGRDILLLSVGDPDFDTPEPIVREAIDSLRSGHTHYVEVQGLPALREAIAAHYPGAGFSADQVVVLAGAQCALFSTVQCLFDPGDEVLVIEPMYVTYDAVFGACGVRPVAVTAAPERGFRPDLRDFRRKLGPRTRGVLVNSPNNPTGASLDRATWNELTALCREHDLWLLSDEVYVGLQYSGEHLSAADFDGLDGRRVILGSLSKSHAMTGWRVGWVIGPAELATHLVNLALCMIYGLPAFIQRAACVALKRELPEVEVMRGMYRERRDRVCAALANCPGIKAHKPDGGLFVLVDIRATGISAPAFAERLLEQHGVSLLAGDAFGPSAAGHLRLGLVLDSDLLEEACRRIARCAAEVLSAQQPRRDIQGEAENRGVEDEADH